MDGVSLTVLWIVGITNAINLIDGLDGLAAGISVIGLTTIAVMAFSADKILILSLSLVVIGSTIGFLFITSIQQKYLWVIQVRYF